MPALQTSLYTLLLVAATISALEAVYAARHRSSAPAAPALALLMAAAAFYSAGSAVEIAASTLAGKELALGIEYIGIAPLPSFWVLFAWRSLHGRRLFPRALAILLAAIPAATLLLNWTNHLHHLAYAAASVDASGPFPVVRLEPGPWYWVNTAFLELSLLAGNMLLLARLLRASAAERASAAVTMGASLAPWAGKLLTLAGASPWGLDTSPLVISIAGLLFAAGLFRFRMRDLVPAARERVFESMNDGVIVIDARRRIVDYNMAAAAICPGLAPQAIGAPASQALADMPALAAAIESGVGGERLNVASPPEPATYDVRLQPIRGTGGMTVGLAVVLTDITGQVTLVRKLQDLATIDELTGLANRRQFFDLGRREIARARREDRPISVALMDLDHFKHVNDRYGHAAGDEALKSVAEACRAAIRLSDLVGRYGGEELAFVFPDADARTAADVAERLRSAIAAAAVEHGGNRIAMTASFGVASSMRPARVDLESLLLCADRALYEAKRNGRNRVEVASVDAG